MGSIRRKILRNRERRKQKLIKQRRKSIEIKREQFGKDIFDHFKMYAPIGNLLFNIVGCISFLICISIFIMLVSEFIKKILLG